MGPGIAVLQNWWLCKPLSDLSCDLEQVTVHASFPASGYQGTALGLFSSSCAQESAAQPSASAALGRVPH